MNTDYQGATGIESPSELLCDVLLQGTVKVSKR